MARETPPSGESAISGARDLAELFVGAQSRQPRDSILQARGGGDWALYCEERAWVFERARVFERAWEFVARQSRAARPSFARQ